MNIATYNACKLNILSCSHKITMSEDYKCEGLTLMGESYSSPSINMWSWVCVITSLDLCFLIYKMRIIIIIILQVSHEYCIYRHICICIYVFICIYLHVYLYVSVCVCVCIYTHTGEGNGNPLQYSCLENPRDRGAWWAAVYGVAKTRTRLTWLSSSSIYMCV